MKHLLTLCCVGLVFVPVMLAHGQDKPTLRLVQTIPLSGVGGRLDHMAVDLEKKRLFVAAVANGTLEVCVHYDADLKRIYMSGGRWYGTPEASSGWVYVYQQKDADHYELASKISTRPGSGTSLFVPKLKRLYVASQAIGDQEASILAFEPVP